MAEVILVEANEGDTVSIAWHVFEKDGSVTCFTQTVTILPRYTREARIAPLFESPAPVQSGEVKE